MDDTAVNMALATARGRIARKRAKAEGRERADLIDKLKALAEWHERGCQPGDLSLYRLKGATASSVLRDAVEQLHVKGGGNG